MKKLKVYVSFLISLLIGLYLGRFTIGITKAQVAGAHVSVAPSAQTVLLGNPATVTIDISGAANVGAYQFDLVYDSAVVQVQSAVGSNWLASTGRTVVPLTPTIDNTTGKTTVGAFSFGAQPGASGDATLVTFTLSTLSNAVSAITIQNLQLVDPAAQAITTLVTNGNVTVSTLNPSASPTVAPSASVSPTLVPSVTPTPSSTPSVTPVVSPSPTSVPSPVPTPTVTPSSAPSSTPVASVSPAPSATASPSVSPSPSVSSSPVPSPVPSASALPSATPAVSTSPTPSATPTPSAQSATLTLTGAQVVGVGDEFIVTVSLNAPQPVVGVDAVLLFDPRRLAAESITDLHLLPQTPGMNVNNGNGTVRISQISPPGQSFTGTGSIAQIHFKALVLGETQIGFDFLIGSKVESNVIATNGADILAAPSVFVLSIVDPATLQLTLSTYTENPSLGDAVSGILSDTESTFSAKMTTDSTGKSNTLQLQTSFVGQLKTFFFKVTGSLRKRFSHTITAGLNSVDLGKLKAGDLNDDGTINTVDLSLVYDQWFGAGGSADLNRDGLVNSADYWVITQNYLAVDE